MSYTLGEAAKATGKSKPTIQRAIKSGKISAVKKENGSYSIEPSELHRIYPVKQSDSNNSTIMKHRVTPSENIGLQAELDVVRQQLESANLERDRERELMGQQIELYRERLERADRDKDQLTALLTNQDKVTSPRKGFFGQTVRLRADEGRDADIPLPF